MTEVLDQWPIFKVLNFEEAWNRYKQVIFSNRQICEDISSIWRPSWRFFPKQWVATSERSTKNPIFKQVQSPKKYLPIALSQWPKMSLLALALTFVYHFLLPPFLCTLGLILCLASFGKSLGIRKIYVNWLLKVFKVSASSILVATNPLNWFSLFFSLQPRLPRRQNSENYPLKANFYWAQMKIQTRKQLKFPSL